MFSGKAIRPDGGLITSELEVWRKNLIRGVFRGAVAFGAIAVALGFFATRTRILSYFYIGLYLAFAESAEIFLIFRFS